MKWLVVFSLLFPHALLTFSQEEKVAPVATAAIKSPESSLTSGGRIVVYPSPMASGLGKGIQENVDLYTGRMGFSIPLLTLKSRSLELPITVSYSTSGQKVNEAGGWLGPGWNMSAGGAITRVMHGMPDEFSGAVNGAPAFGYLNTKSRVNLSTFRAATDYFNKITAIRNADWENGGTQAWDTQPDEFYFNFGGYSGKFVFDQDGNILTVPYANLVITKTILNSALTGNIPKIVKFEVTTPDGTVYVFGDNSLASVEESRLETLTFTNKYKYRELAYFSESDKHVYELARLYQSFAESGNTSLMTYQFFTSTWYLKQIKTLNDDDAINFSYSDAGEITYFQNRSTRAEVPNLSVGAVVINSTLSTEFVSRTAPSDGFFPLVQTFSFSLSEITIRARRLFSIQTETNDLVSFEANTPRADLFGDKRLDKISFSSDGILVKSFKFDFDVLPSRYDIDVFELCFASMQVNAATCPFNIDEEFKRWKSIATGTDEALNRQKYKNIFDSEAKKMFLTKITEVGYNGLNLPPYEFYYNYDTPRLARRLSYMQDAWGYANGNSKGTGIPTLSYTGPEGQAVGYEPNLSFIGWTAIKLPSNGGMIDLNSRIGAFYRANISWAKAGILTKVKLPTGGGKQFFYGANDGSPENSIGLVVNEIREYPDMNDLSKYNSQTYQYDDLFIREGFHLENSCWGFLKPEPNVREDYVVSTSSLFVPILPTHGSPYGFGRATVTKTGFGKTVYEFKTGLDEKNIPSVVQKVSTSGTQEFNNTVFPFPQDTDVDWRRGLLKQVTQFDASNRIVKRSTYAYDTDPSNNSYPSSFQNRVSYSMIGGVYSNFTDHFLAGLFTYVSSQTLPVSITEEIYDQFDPGVETKKITSTTTFDFVRVHPAGSTDIAPDLLPRRTITSFNDGVRITSENKYISDYSLTFLTGNDVILKAMRLLKTRNVSNAMIENISYMERPGDTQKYLLGGSLSLYKNYSANNQVNLNKSLKYKVGLGLPFTNYAWSDIVSNVFTYQTSMYKSQLEIVDYDVEGNPLSVIGEDGIPFAYTWDTTGDNVMLTSTINSGAYQHQTTYQYKAPDLATRITDPNSVNSNYEYDSFSRLKLEKDHNNNILSRYRYSYKGVSSELQNSPITITGCPLPGSSLGFSAHVPVDYGQTQYVWNFGDGPSTTTTSSSMIHAFGSSGNFTVSVKRTNPEYFGEASATASVFINPFTTVQICAQGIVMADLCGIEPPTMRQCTGVGMVEVLQGDAAVDLVFPPGGIQPPTFRATTSSTTYRWQYNLNGGDWIDFGDNAAQVTGPSDFGTMVASYSVRCIVTDVCGSEVISNVVYLSVYESDPSCSHP